MAGPLAGTRVVELAGIGPAPFAAMLLADLGAEVVRVDRVARPGAGGSPVDAGHRILTRGRRSVTVDLKHPDGVAVVLRLAERADALIEGYRPGVAERLGVGPDACLAANPHLVYGRMTGWGQDGPLAHTAGHDIDYIALAGALAMVGRDGEAPTVPLNLIGDFGGGGMLLAVGVLAALLPARATGVGQVVDAAMVDGTATLLSMLLGMRGAGAWGRRGTNLLDGGAPFYDAYRCADGGYVAVGALEDQFYAALVEGLGPAGAGLPDRADPANWPELRSRLAAAFATRTRDEWAAHFADTDACVAPVLDPDEAAAHPHLAGRGTYVRDADGMLQPAPAPRFSATPAGPPAPTAPVGADTRAVLADAGYTPGEIDALEESGAVGAMARR